jgi:hypothetical protein
MESRCIFIAYGDSLKHLEVDKITWGLFSKKTTTKKQFKKNKGWALKAFSAGKRGGAPFF